MRNLLLLLLLFAADLIARDIKKPLHETLEESRRIRTAPKVVVFSYGRKEQVTVKTEVIRSGYSTVEVETTKTTRDRAVQVNSYLDPFKACGIEVKHHDDVPLGQVADVLKSERMGPNDLGLLNAHGSPGYESPSRYQVGSENSPLKFFDGDRWVQEAVSVAKKSKFWLGTCHAGICSLLDKSTCIGGECKAHQVAHNKLFAFHEIAKLMCDAHSGDCKRWRSADRNGDGKLDAQELDDHIRSTGQKEEFVSERYAGCGDERCKERAQKNLRAECERDGGTEKEVSASARWTLAYDSFVSGKPETFNSEVYSEDIIDPTLITKLESDVAFRTSKRSFHDFPDGTRRKLKKTIDRKYYWELEKPKTVTRPAPRKVEGLEDFVKSDTLKKLLKTTYDPEKMKKALQGEIQLEGSPCFKKGNQEGRNCELELQMIEISHVCLIPPGHFKVEGQFYHPEMAGFHLESSRCKTPDGFSGIR